MLTKYRNTELVPKLGMLLAVLALSSGASVAAVAAEEESAAQAVVESLHSGLAALSAAAPVPLEARYRELAPLITATHDLPFIAELTIRRQWRDLGSAERDAFVAAFARLSIMTYASRFDAVAEDAFRILGRADAGSGRVQIKAAIARPDGTEIPLDYTLENRAQGWRIINIFADGVSDLALKRAEYQRILASGSLEQLIAHVDAQTESLD